MIDNIKPILIALTKTIGILVSFLGSALLIAMFPKTMLTLIAGVIVFIPVYSYEIHKG